MEVCALGLNRLYNEMIVNLWEQGMTLSFEWEMYYMGCVLKHLVHSWHC